MPELNTINDSYVILHMGISDAYGMARTQGEVVEGSRFKNQEIIARMVYQLHAIRKATENEKKQNKVTLTDSDLNKSAKTSLEDKIHFLETENTSLRDTVMELNNKLIAYQNAFEAGKPMPGEVAPQKNAQPATTLVTDVVDVQMNKKAK